ncbi:hypothetical protein RRG08_039240 [Elysia crispata]|uniref:Uncharacterized protein n=1 Tax=Elysia crispata TaxID=231223 RepID=A0AAE1BE85_9GAST|nr:hypothetical protein RRG08_039240 [Elysia crispata]
MSLNLSILSLTHLLNRGVVSLCRIFPGTPRIKRREVAASPSSNMAWLIMPRWGGGLLSAAQRFSGDLGNEKSRIRVTLAAGMQQNSSEFKDVKLGGLWRQIIAEKKIRNNHGGKKN